MEYTWACMVLSVLVTTLSAAPLNNESKNKTYGTHWLPANCSYQDWLRCGGICDPVKCQQTKQLCKDLRKELAQEVTQQNSTNHTATESDVSCLADLLLSPEQAISLKEAHANSRRTKRKIRSDFQSNKWDNTIHFKIDVYMSDDGKRSVKEGINLWTSTTCIKFVEVDKDFNQPHLIFVQAFMGCSSYIGRVSSLTAQPIYVSYNCFTKAVIAHEIAHALGAIHEHQRPDRDSYVTIRANQIDRGYEAYFATFKPTVVTELAIQYDYASVMHYYGTAFSKNSELTIETKDPKYQKTIGQRVELSFLDVKLINKAYCPSTCTNTLSQSCKNHGYQDPHDCNKCRCPDGWTGTYCGNIAPAKHASCGGVLTAASSAQYITSPGYQYNSYEAGQECTWLIQAQGNKRIRLEFSDTFALFGSYEGTTCYHWVEVRSELVEVAGNTELSIKGPRYCGSNKPSDVIISTGNSVMVLFRAKYNLARKQEMVGFKLRYTADGDACSSQPCLNSGTCMEENSGFICKCINGYYGKLCQHYRFELDTDINLVMMLDSTYHSYKDFYYFKEMSKKLFSYTSSSGHTVNRGLMTFDQWSRSHVHLDESTNLNILNNIIVSLYTNYGGTNIFDAFNLLFQKFYLGNANNNKNIVPNVAIMTTDSHHSGWTSQGMIGDVTSKLRDRCVEVIIIEIKVRGELLGQIVNNTYILHRHDQVVLLDANFIHNVLTAVKSAVRRSYDCIKALTTTTSTTTTTASTTTSTTASTTVTTHKTVPTTTKRTTTKPTTVRTTKVQTQKNTPSTTTTTTTSMPSTTKPTTATTQKPSSEPRRRPDSEKKCSRVEGECDRECGGCGYRNVKQTCYLESGDEIVDEYREPCNLKPCEKDCSVWIGMYYPRICKICCPGFIQEGDNCIQNERKPPP